MKSIINGLLIFFYLLRTLRFCGGKFGDDDDEGENVSVGDDGLFVRVKSFMTDAANSNVPVSTLCYKKYIPFIRIFTCTVLFSYTEYYLLQEEKLSQLFPHVQGFLKIAKSITTIVTE